MDKLLYRTLLFDFYGELLTDKQQNVFEMHYINDYSLQEVAEENNTSRQAVADIVKRTEKILMKYEEKLHLIKKHVIFQEQKNNILLRIDDINSHDLIEVRMMIMDLA